MVSSSLSKYRFNDPVEAANHRGAIIGRHPDDGMPVRGDPTRPPDLVGNQIDELPRVCDAYAEMFRMWVSEEHRRYTEILDRIFNGAYTSFHREIIRCPAEETDGHGQHLKIYLEWAQLYIQAETPKINSDNRGLLG